MPPLKLPNRAELQSAISATAFAFLGHNESKICELECRLGTADASGFFASIRKVDFIALLQTFTTHFQNNRGFYIEHTYDVIVDAKRVTINASNGEVLEVIEKQNRRKKDFESGARYSLRVSCASEYDAMQSSRANIQ